MSRILRTGLRTVAEYNKVEHKDTNWVIPKGDYPGETGTRMRVPMACYIATGNVNDAKVCTPVTKITYMVQPYGGVMPDPAGFTTTSRTLAVRRRKAKQESTMA